MRAGCLFFALALAACSRPEPTADRAAPSPSPAASHAPGGARFSDGKKTFEAMEQTLFRRYDAAGISEDDLYRAAAEGMLARVDPARAKWNELLTPQQLDSVRRQHGDETAGFGIRYSLDPTIGMRVSGTVVGSTAEKAGMRAGDVILRIDGHVLKGADEEHLAEYFRGDVGSVAEMAILRDAEILTLRVPRAPVSFDDVRAIRLAEGVGYLRLAGISPRTPEKVRAALAELAATPAARAVIFDLRTNSGGVFDGVTATASELLPEGAPVAAVIARGEPQRIVARGGAPLAGARLVVLVDGETAAGAELLAQDLREARGARVVGARTFGKWNVQNVERLENGWGMKYTAARFESGGGKSFEGEGLSPDVEVRALDEAALDAAMSIVDPVARLAADPPLRTALEIVRDR